jgi:hypothetical protein
MRRWVPAFVAAAALASLPAAAQQASSGWPWSPHPTDTGKPLIFDPQAAAKAEADRLSACPPLLQCRLQLLGVIQNNGAVELRATAPTW